MERTNKMANLETQFQRYQAFLERNVAGRRAADYTIEGDGNNRSITLTGEHGTIRISLAAIPGGFDLVGNSRCGCFVEENGGLTVRQNERGFQVNAAQGAGGAIAGAVAPAGQPGPGIPGVAAPAMQQARGLGIDDIGAALAQGGVLQMLGAIDAPLPQPVINAGNPVKPNSPW